jgi:hypothetical protein
MFSVALLGFLHESSATEKVWVDLIKMPLPVVSNRVFYPIFRRTPGDFLTTGGRRKKGVVTIEKILIFAA